ncbi:glycoside hydrolase family 13 protein [Salipaludibacillus sp. CF4.18]|uniref:glycoside hydrolase family 13 protein n=1 Tax=Salipaludibacillus sp. CF4.18 TaxID=3373081 RepID=UPI003EE6B09E
MDKKWWHDSVVYQIYPRSFNDSNDDGIGDIKGVIEKLNYLEYLGIDVIWLSPVYTSPMDDNGYDISDYQNIAKEFGTMEEIDLLIEKAAEKNIKIIMDLVINHTSDEHSWFIQSRSDKSNPKRDWYIWRDGKKDGSAPNNLRSIFGGSCWEYDKTTDQYYFHAFSKKQPDLNWENPEVRKELFTMIKWWLDRGIGGFRVDAITFIKKPEEFNDFPTSSTDGLSTVKPNEQGVNVFLSELAIETFSAYDILTVAEAPGVTPDELPKFVGDQGYFSMLIEFDHVDVDIGEDGKWYPLNDWVLKDFKKAITNSQRVIQEEGWTALYLENHDQPRSLNKFVPNEDISDISGKMLAMVYFLLKGTPYIYQGQEIGMTNVLYPSITDYDDIASIDQYHSAITDGYSEDEALSFIHNRSRDNARTPMQWSEGGNSGFTNGKPWLKVNQNYTSVNVENALNDKNSLFYFYKELIELRKNSDYKEVIKYGEYEEKLENHSHVFAYTRQLREQTILVIANFTNEEIDIVLEEKVKLMIIGNYDNASIDLKELQLRPYESVVYDIQT